MKHSMEVNGNHVTIVLNGKMYAHDAGTIRDEVLEEINKGNIDIRMNLSQLEYIDSSGLGVVITIHKRIKEKNGKLVLMGAQGIVAQLLKRTRLDTVLTIES